MAKRFNKLSERLSIDFSQRQLKNMTIRCSEKMRNANTYLECYEFPYKHLVIDDFFDPKLADSCLQ